jgi:hypothetical protein
MGPLVLLVQLELLDWTVRLEQQEQRVYLELTEQRVPLELLGFKEMLERLAQRVSKETLERLGQRVISEPQAQQELQDWLGLEELLVLLEFKEVRGQLALPLIFLDMSKSLVIQWLVS